MSSPDRRSTCKFCKRIISQTGSERWTASQLAGFGGNPECNMAPNPDDGPMPGHEPGFIAERPAESGYVSRDETAGTLDFEAFDPLPWIPPQVSR